MKKLNIKFETHKANKKYWAKKKLGRNQAFPSSGDRTRTDDLWVMSPTSYQLLHPAIYQRVKITQYYELKSPNEGAL